MLQRAKNIVELRRCAFSHPRPSILRLQRNGNATTESPEVTYVPNRETSLLKAPWSCKA